MMPRDRMRKIRFLKVLLLVRTERDLLRFQRLHHPLHTRKADYRAGDALVDPRQSNLPHRAVVLLGKLLYSPDDHILRLVIVLRASTNVLLVFRFTPGGLAEIGRRTRQTTGC